MNLCVLQHSEIALYTQGLQVGDEIIQFGSVSAANFVNMQSIAAVVEHSKGVSCRILCTMNISLSALTLLFGHQEEHPAC